MRSRRSRDTVSAFLTLESRAFASEKEREKGRKKKMKEREREIATALREKRSREATRKATHAHTPRHATILQACTSEINELMVRQSG